MDKRKFKEKEVEEVPAGRHRTDSKTLIDDVTEHLERYRYLFVEALESKVLDFLSSADTGTSQPHSDKEWIGIESLSRLRSIVGGRFQNLKQKWTEAGFPLREHRGDKAGEFEIDQRGWLELSAWILKQGYEARLNPSKAEYLFEVRAKG